MRLTASQYEIWQQQQQLASTAMLNIGEYVEIRGSVREDLLAAAIRSTVAETPALHLRIRDTADGPRQEPEPVDCPIHVADLRDRPDPLVAAQDWMAADMATDRCVYADRLFAHAVLRIGDDTVLWYHRVHHIVLDGYGLVLVARRVAQTYTALAVGTVPPPVNFGSLEEVAEHDHRDRLSEEYTRAAEFWAAYERDRPEPVGAANRTAPLSPRMTRVITDLTPELATTLRGLDTATSAEALIAGVAAYLHRLTGADQINLVLPVMMRIGTPALRVPTMTVNAIHCWTTFTPATTFTTVTTQVRDHLRTSRPHHRYRYGDLLRNRLSANVDRRISGPSVNVMPFDFGLRFGDAPGTVRNVAAGVEEDIAFRFYDYGASGIRLILDANPALYTPAELEAHARRLPHFLKVLLSQSDRPIVELDLIDTADHALLNAWRDREAGSAAEPGAEKANESTPARDTRPPGPGLVAVPADRWLPTAMGARAAETVEDSNGGTVIGMLRARVREMPERIAVVDAERRIEFAELGRRVEALAGSLNARGVGPGSVVLLVMPRTVDAIVALFATLASGAAYVAADPDHPDEHLEFLHADSGAAVVVSAGDLAQRLPERLRATLIAADEPIECGVHHREGPADAHANLPTVYADTPLCLTYTSGTTGKPKGALITHRAMVNLAESHRRTLIADPAEPKRAALTASLCFDTSWEGLLWLLNGHELHVVSSEVRGRPELLVEYVARHRIDFLDVTPTSAEQLVAAGLLAPGAHRPAVLALGGEAVGPALWKALRAVPEMAVYNLYGPSEATVDATWARVKDSAEPVIGEAVSGVRCQVLDSRLRPVPPGTPGELYLAGESLALGYHRRHGQTAARFIADPAGSGTRCYRTGDRVRRLLDGRLEYLGRTDDQVNLAGVRIEPAAIEAALATHPGVTSAACAVVDDRLIGYVVTGGVPPRSAELRRHLLDRVPRYQIPAAYIVLDRMPVTVTGKLDRAALPRPAVAEPFRPPRGEREHSLCALFAEVLGVPAIGVDDDFFALGGDSVTAARLATRIRDELAAPVEVRTIFETATVAELAAEMAAEGPCPRPVPDLAADARLDPDFQVPGTDVRPANTPLRIVALGVAAPPAHIAAQRLCIAAQPSDIGTPASGARILLTGATGFLGAFLLDSLLRLPGTRVTCLVRPGGDGRSAADSDRDAVGRLRESLRRYGIEVSWDRVGVVAGDLTRPALGLGADAYRALAESVDVIVHNGAPVHHLTPYARLRSGIVDGTREVLRLAVAHHAIPVHYISACDTAVAADINPDPILEGHRADATKVLANGYIQAKWVAEGLVLAAGELGLPVAVHRPGRISGHSRTGAGNDRDAFWTMVRAMVALGVVPEDAAPVNLVPVDHVADAVAHLLHTGATGVYHHVAPEPTSLATVLERLHVLGYRLTSVPEPTWIDLLPRLGGDGEQCRALLQARPPIPRGPIRFDRTHTERGLRGANIATPHLDAHAVDAGIRFFLRTGFLPAPDATSVA
ncbi:amino acid adenylation domain-containing protein [Nocardia sp. NPDC059240]|uniref:amino acid adenylation domain-containing protein n=1 Tax=Nocardia sp. NPDC059240 TaxID=3346786 RepID=UPI0036878394